MTNPKHIALIVYYWPPTGGSGVQRWLFLANYLSNNGIKVTVFTPTAPRIAETDFSLSDKINKNIEVIYVQGWEPLQHSKKEIGENIGLSNGVKSRFMRYVRANFFVPDARVFWAKEVAKTFLKKHANTTFDLLITSGPPHSLHVAGLRVKEKNNIPWIADFRDPWVGFFQNQSLPMTKAVKLRHKQLQHRVLKTANRVVVTAHSLAADFLSINKNTHVLTNGYEALLPQSKEIPGALVYTGSLKAQQNPSNLWRAILELVQENKIFATQFSLEIYGKVADVVKLEVKTLGIDKWVKFLGYRPKSALDKFLPNAKALLLLGIDMPNTHNIIHGKLFEYMAANRPILGIGPKPSDMEALFTAHQLGVYSSFDNYPQIKSTLFDWFTKADIPFKSKRIDQYQRDVIAKKYLNLIVESA